MKISVRFCEMLFCHMVFSFSLLLCLLWCIPFIDFLFFKDFIYLFIYLT